MSLSSTKRWTGGWAPSMQDEMGTRRMRKVGAPTKLHLAGDGGVVRANDNQGWADVQPLWLHVDTCKERHAKILVGLAKHSSMHHERRVLAASLTHEVIQRANARLEDSLFGDHLWAQC